MKAPSSASFLLLGLVLMSLSIADVANAQEHSAIPSASEQLEAEIVRIQLLTGAKREITKALESTKYKSAVQKRDAQLRAMYEIDMKRLRATTDWNTAPRSVRQKGIEVVQEVSLARLKYDDLARDRLLDRLCLTPEDVTNPDSSCYQTLYSPKPILSE